MTGDGRIVLIRQERIPIREAIWEMPSGQIDRTVAGISKERRLGQPSELDGWAAVTPCSETMEQVALRELREETGYGLAKDGELVPLGHYFSSPGFTDERGYFFLARPVQPCKEGPARDEAESILDCREFTVEEIRRMIAENQIRDANTLGICATLAARGVLALAPR